MVGVQKYVYDIFGPAVNAAMEFNSETLLPTFHLRLGLPGRSNAFDIAERLGIDRELVGRVLGSLRTKPR